MKCLHVIHTYSPSVGGTQWLFQNISERLVSEYGDEVTVFTTTAYTNRLFWDPREPSLPTGEELVNGVNVRRFPVFNRLSWLRLNAARVAHKLRLPGEDWLRGLYFGPIIPGLARAVATDGADIIVASAFPLLHMHTALWGARRAGLPVIFVGGLHPADHWCFDRPMIYRAIRQVDTYIAYTTYERDYLLNRGVSPDRVVVIGPGVNVDAFVHADGRDIRSRYGWGNAPVVAIVGQQAEHKRIDLVVAAMRRVWQVLPDARLLIAGTRTPYSAHIDGLLDKLPPEQKKATTVVDDFCEADKPALISACDLLVLPSSHESFGLVFLEAWACGKPVIGARVGAIPSVIDEGVNGLLARYGDENDWARAITELASDSTQQARMGEAGRKKVLAHHTWKTVTARFRSVYERVVITHHCSVGPQEPPLENLWR
jgi:glycosyltransferase involved in cell wall biosynthesis